MKLSVLLSVVFGVSSLVAGEEIIAQWDFSSGSVKSLDGKFVALKRGNTRIVGTGEARRLVIPQSPRFQPEGIKLQKNYPELSPQGAFGLRAEFTLRANKDNSCPISYIWDSMYINYKTKQSDKVAHHGFMIYIKTEKNGMLTPIVYVGHGSFSSSFCARAVKFPEDGKCKLDFKYNGKDYLFMEFNGIRSSYRVKKAGGNLVKSHYGISIGDRFSNSFSHLNGELKSLTLYRPTK